MKTNYEQMGMAALLPGMQHMLDLMQQELDNMRATLQAHQQPQKVGRAGLNRLGEPVKPGYWSKMTPEERSAEVRRRFAMRSKLSQKRSLEAMRAGKEAKRAKANGVA